MPSRLALTINVRDRRKLDGQPDVMLTLGVYVSCCCMQEKDGDDAAAAAAGSVSKESGEVLSDEVQPAMSNVATPSTDDTQSAERRVTRSAIRQQQNRCKHRAEPPATSSAHDTVTCTFQ